MAHVAKSSKELIHQLKRPMDRKSKVQFKKSKLQIECRTKEPKKAKNKPSSFSGEEDKEQTKLTPTIKISRPKPKAYQWRLINDQKIVLRGGC